MPNLHPSSSANGKWIRIGKTSLWKCGMCGFPRNANRGLPKQTEEMPDGVISTGIFGTSATSSDETITFDYAGGCCPMCGTFRSGPMHKVSQLAQGKGIKRRHIRPAGFHRRVSRF